MNQIYTSALELEEKKFFAQAYENFQKCLMQDIGCRAEVLFHSGWCLEQQFGNSSEEALIYYLEGAETGSENSCAMNCSFRAGWILMHLKNFNKASINFSNSRRIGIEHRLINNIFADATYWLAICLEAQNHYLEALKLYKELETYSFAIAPESKWREINCLNQIGFYDEALKTCNSFYSVKPEGFDELRFSELRQKVQREKEILSQIIFSQ
ncbi:MAG TPA: hypothetical protein PKA80_08640 [Ignavibacteriaceae bacterium]|nr:hypothetical protein [Ignavibacteriaceae bacterium]